MTYALIDDVHVPEEELVAKRSGEFPPDEIRNWRRRMKPAPAGGPDFARPRIARVVFFDDRHIREQLNGHLKGLTLVVTDDCTLRCRYCFVRGRRTGGSVSYMTSTTARKAVDFYFSRASHSEKSAVFFYGGEPLLHFELIRDCVAYAESRAERRAGDFGFTITTNGTLLTEEILDFLIHKDIGLAVSLDGPADIHDRYRTSEDGKPSHALVMGNLERIREKNPEYYDRRVGLSMVLAPPFDLPGIETWFERRGDLLSGRKITMSFVIDPPGDFYREYSPHREADREAFLAQRASLRSRLGNSDKADPRTEVFSRNICLPDIRNLHGRRREPLRGEDFFLDALCIPGLKNLIVHADGGFSFCSNIGEHLSIGNLDSGFDFEAIRRLIDLYIDISRPCLRCWALRLCPRNCFISAFDGSKLDAEYKNAVCETFRTSLTDSLISYAEILEEGRLEHFFPRS
jgi:uncharacterized protein